MPDGAEALEQIAAELGVKPSTLAQWCDSAGSYGRWQNAHSTPHRRTLPPRGSSDGMILAARIQQACGTTKIRTLAVRLARND